MSGALPTENDGGMSIPGIIPHISLEIKKNDGTCGCNVVRALDLLHLEKIVEFQIATKQRTADFTYTSY